MTDIGLKMGERGKLRLFTLDEESPDLRLIAPDLRKAADVTIAQLLGLPTLPPNSAEIIRIDDVSALGLRDFLIEGHDVLPEALGPDFDWLDKLKGHVLLVHSAMSADGDVTLHPAPGVGFVGVFPLATAPLAPIHIPAKERPETLGGVAQPPARSAKGGGAILLLLALLAAIGLLLFGVPVGALFD